MKTIKYEELVKSKWCTSPPSKNIESTYLVSSLKSNLTFQILINGIFALYFNLEKKIIKKWELHHCVMCIACARVSVSHKYHKKKLLDVGLSISPMKS